MNSRSWNIASDKATKWSSPGQSPKCPPKWLLAKLAKEAAEKKAKREEVQAAADIARVQMKKSYGASKEFLKAARRGEMDGTVDW